MNNNEPDHKTHPIYIFGSGFGVAVCFSVMTYFISENYIAKDKAEHFLSDVEKNITNNKDYKPEPSAKIEPEKKKSTIKTSKIFVLCLGDKCPFGDIKGNCEDRQNESSLISNYCISQLGVGSRVIKISRTTWGGDQCGYIKHMFRCEISSQS